MILNRTEAFVPLTSAASANTGAGAEFHATVVSQPQQLQKFHSVESSATSAGAARGANCEARITVQRDGEHVAGVRIQCSCGQIIDLACVYEKATPAQPAAPRPQTAATAEPPPPAAQEIPQEVPPAVSPGKSCKETGKVLPVKAAKQPKVPEKGRGTSSAKRRSA